MVNNLVALNGIEVSNATIGLWVVAAILLAIIVVRRKVRKAREQR